MGYLMANWTLGNEEVKAMNIGHQTPVTGLIELFKMYPMYCMYVPYRFQVIFHSQIRSHSLTLVYSNQVYYHVIPIEHVNGFDILPPVHAAQFILLVICTS